MSGTNLGPFATTILDDKTISGVVDVEGRLSMVKQFGLRDCYRALEVNGLQATVRKAVERRIKQLKKTPLDYDPNFNLSGCLSCQTVRLTFGMWRYRLTLEVPVKGNLMGFDAIRAAVENVYESLPARTVYDDRGRDEEMAEIQLQDPDGDTLRVEDDELKGEDWLRDMVIAAEIIDIEPAGHAREVL